MTGKLQIFVNGSLGIFCEVIRDFRNTHNVAYIVVEVGYIPLVKELALGRKAN